MAITAGPSVRGTRRHPAAQHHGALRATDAAGNTSRGVAGTRRSIRRPRSAPPPCGCSTNGRAVGDKLVIDTGANAETVKIATIPTPAPASPSPNVNLATALTKAHAADTAVQAFPQFRTIAVPIDTQLPTAALPGHGRQQPHRPRPDRSRRPAPTRPRARAAPRCVTPGSTARGPTRCRSTPRSSRSASTRGRSASSDNAGNGNRVKFTFLVTTSFADVDALLTRWGTAGTIPAAAVTSLRAKLAAAKAASDVDDAVAAIGQLQSFAPRPPASPTPRRATC